MFTSSGELAQFIDDNQFGSGQSTMKCGPEAVALFWHSVRPGLKNPYTSADIHRMASSDYARFIGPDVPSDKNGTSDQTLYALLSFHNFHWRAIAMDMAVIKSWLESGYPVILGIYESSVDDLSTGGIPYSWGGGFTHIVVASGPGDGDEILVRDTANIAPDGVRPGPRRYRASALKLTSATLVVPTWLPVPPDSPTPPPVPPHVPDYRAQAKAAIASLSELIDKI